MPEFKTQPMTEALVIKTDISYILFFSQDADDIDYICTHPEIVRVPDPEILLVLKFVVFMWCSLALKC